ncbi:16S rRNA (guanine(527)-N(7))-methyltransferase RsmG [Lewinella cohaerens]|uniref:16S rRNA (guanine(527)-N(7))-methyltransferase RsmG n=1 Tax=Lewinella cohaerens TaxID=70995 RepID=UPI0003825F7F|nr:16S rRNA (guanine(527)-N(7))-methyltransferase RsmG [Lewinella cohaerens]
MDAIKTYFPDLTADQLALFEQLDPLYREWNQKINVISRKDIDNLYLHHVLHSLAIAKVVKFMPGARILDLGTGGGFPGIPLAILFPETEFVLIDGIRKKITVVNEVATALGLKNVQGFQQRAEERKGRSFDFVITRAVALMEKIVPWSMPLIHDKQLHALPNGIIALKGGNVKEELQALPRGTYSEIYPIKKMFSEEFFIEKSVVYVQY